MKDIQKGHILLQRSIFIQRCKLSKICAAHPKFWLHFKTFLLPELYLTKLFQSLQQYTCFKNSKIQHPSIKNKMRAKKRKILPLFWIFTRGNPEIIAQFWCHHVRLCLSYLHANFADMPTKLTYSKVQKTWFFGLFLAQKSVFCDFTRGNSV